MSAPKVEPLDVAETAFEKREFEYQHRANSAGWRRLVRRLFATVESLRSQLDQSKFLHREEVKQAEESAAEVLEQVRSDFKEQVESLRSTIEAQKEEIADWHKIADFRSAALIVTETKIEEQAREIERLKNDVQVRGIEAFRRIEKRDKDEIARKDQALRTLRDTFLEYGKLHRSKCEHSHTVYGEPAGSPNCDRCIKAEANEALATLAEAAIGEVEK